MFSTVFLLFDALPAAASAVCAVAVLSVTDDCDEIAICWLSVSEGGCS